MLEEFQIKRTETLLDWGLLPHLGKHPENRKEKAHFLGEAVCKLIELKLVGLIQMIKIIMETK